MRNRNFVCAALTAEFKISHVCRSAPSVAKAGAAAAILACVLLTACIRRPPAPAAPPDTDFRRLDYVDIRAGWRLRVVVPILRSGGYIVPMTTRTEGHTILASTSKDFVGYETDYYDVLSRKDSGIRIRFHGAKAVVQGKVSRRRQPILPLFNMPPNLRFARVVFLTRVSQHDHDMVVVMASDQATLEKITNRVVSNDPKACQGSPDMLCLRVPPGIAIVPEHSR